MPGGMSFHHPNAFSLYFLLTTPTTLRVSNTLPLCLQLHIAWYAHLAARWTLRLWFVPSLSLSSLTRLHACWQRYGRVCGPANVLSHSGRFTCLLFDVPSGEWEFGGFPWWLLAKEPAITLRTYEPGYIAEVDRFAYPLHTRQHLS